MYILTEVGANVCPQELEKVFQFVNSLLNLIKIAVPILLILVGSVDLAKAVIAGEDKDIKAAQGMLLKRTGAAVAVFFVGTLVALVMSLVNEDWNNCLNQQSNNYNNSSIAVIHKH